MHTLLSYRPLSSTPCDLCSAYLLPTVHLGNTALYLNRSTLLGGSRQQAKGFALKQFHNPPFFYLGRPRILQEQVHQQTPGRSHPHNGVGIWIRSSTLPRTIAYAAEQLHQQDVWQIASVYNSWQIQIRRKKEFLILSLLPRPISSL